MVSQLFAFLLFLAAAAVVGFFAWTLVILFRQRRAWRAFAAARHLTYTPPPRLMDSPAVSGTLGGLAFSLFGSTHIRPSARVQATKRTTIEISLRGSMPTAAVLATGGMIDLAAAPDLNVGAPISIKLQGFDGPLVARAQDAAAAQAFFTPERLAPIARLARARGVWIILLTQEEEMLLRLDTPDPLDDAERLEAAARAMIGAARVLVPPEASSA